MSTICEVIFIISGNNFHYIKFINELVFSLLGPQSYEECYVEFYLMLGSTSMVKGSLV